ncbi:MAG: hypothetical protein IJW24_04995 [Clostridia bacterium]|nr:hypothetical protein [Clostridia bacterium]
MVLHFGTTNHVCAPEQRRMVRLGLKLQVMIAQHETVFKALLSSSFREDPSSM